MTRRRTTASLRPSSSLGIAWRMLRSSSAAFVSSGRDMGFVMLLGPPPLLRFGQWPGPDPLQVITLPDPDGRVQAVEVGPPFHDADAPIDRLGVPLDRLNGYMACQSPSRRAFYRRQLVGLLLGDRVPQGLGDGIRRRRTIRVSEPVGN